MIPHIGIPEAIMLALMVYGVTDAYQNDGELKPSSQCRHNAKVAVIGTAINFGILLWGGFFT